MSSLTLEPLDLFVDSDADLIVQAHGWEWPEEPVTREQLQRGAQLHPQCYWSYWAMREGADPIAVLSVCESSWQQGLGKAHLDLHFNLAREREDLLIRALEHLEQHADKAGFREAYVYVREDRPGRSELLERLGYQMEMIDKATQAHLEDFDVAAFEHLLSRPSELGCRIATLAELDEQGMDWKRDYYFLRNQLLQDVPISGGWHKAPFEESAKVYDDPLLWCKELAAVLFDPDGKMIGTSEIFPNHHLSTSASTGLTGVAREWRRKGLASALKVFLMAAAKRQGILHLTTGNEEHNPMLDLNYQLGFRDWFTMRTMRKDLPSQQRTGLDEGVGYTKS